MAAIRCLVDERPSHGYRRIAALLKRQRRADGLVPLNAKRVYRLMKRHGLLPVMRSPMCVTGMGIMIEVEGRTGRERRRWRRYGSRRVDDDHQQCANSA